MLFPDTVSIGPAGFNEMGRHNTGKLDSSGSSKTNRYLPLLDNDGHVSAATGKFHHFLQFFRVRLYVEKDCLLPIGFTSLSCVGSAHRAKDHYFCRHLIYPFLRNFHGRLPA